MGTTTLAIYPGHCAKIEATGKASATMAGALIIDDDPESLLELSELAEMQDRSWIQDETKPNQDKE